MRLSLLTLCLLFAACTNKPSHPQVRIANVGTGLQMWCLPVSLAQTLGYYQDEGLDVSLENLASGAKTMQALIGGSVDVADQLYEHNLQIAVEGQRVRSFFVMTRRDIRVIVVAPSASQRIRRIEDLKGALIGVPSPGSGGHQFVNYILAAHGLRTSDFRTVGVGMGVSVIAAIESGRIDAADMVGDDYLRLRRRHPGLLPLVDGNAPEVMHETFHDAFAGGTLSAKQEWLDRNPDTARNLARALLRTQQWIAAHTPEEIRDRLPESFRSQDRATDLEIIRWGRAMYTTDGAMPKGAPESLKHFLDATVDKVRDSKLDLASTWTNDFLLESK